MNKPGASATAPYTRSNLPGKKSHTKTKKIWKIKIDCLNLHRQNGTALPVCSQQGVLAHLARARHWQCRGERFESAILHFPSPSLELQGGRFFYFCCLHKPSAFSLPLLLRSPCSNFSFYSAFSRPLSSTRRFSRYLLLLAASPSLL